MNRLKGIALSGSALALCVLALGCGVRRSTGSLQSASEPTPHLRPDQRADAEVAKTILDMTPEQRVAYVRAHPEIGRQPGR